MYPEDLDPQFLQGYLANVSRVERSIAENIAGRTIADYAFGQGDAKGGAVLYDVVTGEFVNNVEEIAEGANFPVITINSDEPKLAKVDKYGGAVEMLWAAIRRNETDTWDKRQRVLENLVIQKVNAVAMKAIVDAPLKNTVTASAAWTGTSDPVLDILAAKSAIDDAELGYTADIGFIHPDDALLLGQKDIRSQFDRSGNEINSVLSKDLDGIGDLEWIKSRRVTKGEIYIAQRGVFGSIRDEQGGLQTNIYDENNRHVKVVQAWRNIVPVITDPKALTVIKGIR